MNNLPGTRSNVPCALVLQLARLGDLVQTLPVLSALREHFPNCRFDVLCPAPLVPLAASFPDVETVLPWQADAWRALACEWNGNVRQALSCAAHLLPSSALSPYPLAYNLNNHPRAILAAHLLSSQVRGVGTAGPLSPDPNPWVQYLRLVAAERGRNPIHLIDALCGLCGVFPPTRVPCLRCETGRLPRDLETFLTIDGRRVAVVIGAGDSDRRVPVSVWKEWITRLLDRAWDTQVLLVGGPGERAIAAALLDRLPAGCLGRVWDASGRVGFRELVALLAGCHWVIGSDTGPVHVGAACGAHVMAFYFSRARVHETGPYGEGHWIWQAMSFSRNERSPLPGNARSAFPENWPISESIAVLLDGRCPSIPSGWSLWNSHRDEMGAWYENHATGETFRHLRSDLWVQLNAETAVDWPYIRHVLSEPGAAIAN